MKDLMKDLNRVAREVSRIDRLSTFELHMIVREMMGPLQPVVMRYWNEFPTPVGIARVIQVTKRDRPGDREAPRLLSDLAESSAAFIRARTGFEVLCSTSKYPNYSVSKITVQERTKGKQ